MVRLITYSFCREVLTDHALQRDYCRLYICCQYWLLTLDYCSQETVDADPLISMRSKLTF